MVRTVAIRQLQTMFFLFTALAVMMSFTKMALGLFNFAMIEFASDKPKVDDEDRADINPVDKTEDDSSFALDEASFAFRDATALQQAVTKTRNGGRQLVDAELVVREKLASLRQEETRLTGSIEERRNALRNTEQAAQRLSAEQSRTAQQIQSLRAEKDELERRLTALHAAANEAQQLRVQATTQLKEPLGPQVVECVQGEVILLPQQTHISIAELNRGQISSYAKKNGVYFVVRPAGFDSFIAARQIAGKFGLVVGYEPSEPGEEK